MRIEDLIEAAAGEPEAVRAIKDIKPDYTLGCPVWPGLAKVIEESGEFQRIAGKIMAVYGETDYFDGSDLVRPLEEELADIVAATAFMVQAAGLDSEFINNRAEQKLSQFIEWSNK